jgi:hypothetical protein
LFNLDLRQLKPVCASSVFSNVKSELGDLIGNPLWESFQSYELTEIMRQKNDAAFANALNRLARGEMNEEDIKMFKTREVIEVGYPPKNCLRLYKDNKSVSEYNEKALNKIREESAVSMAIDVAQGKGKPEWKASLLESVKNLPTIETMGLPYLTRLVVSARYMVTLNVETTDGLVNGSLGILRKLSYSSMSDGTRIPTTAWIDFGDVTVGSKRRKNLKHLFRNELVTPIWTPMNLEKRCIKSWPGRDLKVIVYVNSNRLSV